MSQARIYMDNAAATPIDRRVLVAMEPFWNEVCGNAGALHAEGVQAHRAVEAARAQVAEALGARPEEIVFTSGGTEANNLAVMGLVRARMREGTAPQDLHVVTSVIEHSSILDCMRALEAKGVQVTYVPVDECGHINLPALKEALRPQTVLVSLILAHNEIGTIQRMSEVAQIVRASRKTHDGRYLVLHVDASQAPAWISCDVRKLGVDMLTLDAQKIYGPKGVGCLYRREGITLAPVLYGGGQEFGVRPGTPPTPLIVGFAHALSLIESERASYLGTITSLRDELIAGICVQCPSAVLHGPMGDERIANNINISFPGLDAEQIVLELDARGIAASTRSACLLGDAPGSYVVRALGKGDAVATSAVRFSLSRHTTREEVDAVVQAIGEVVPWLYAHTT